MKVDLPTYMKLKYEKMFNEPWSELEKRVREQNKDFFEMYDNLPETSPIETVRWWQFWK